MSGNDSKSIIRASQHHEESLLTEENAEMSNDYETGNYPTQNDSASAHWNSSNNMGITHHLLQQRLKAGMAPRTPSRPIINATPTHNLPTTV